MRTSALQYLYLQKPISSVVIICAIALLPWMGDDFYTKGEPREAAVAVSMIKSGNWILPTVYADEFAYKPPMTHWLIAAFSTPQGYVSEWTARLPSALAQIVLVGFVLVFFGKRMRFQEAFIATLLLLTCFEIHRAGLTARVDMLLTTLTVIGLMRLYRWENKLELKGLPIEIPLLLSGATLTKGPVGIILPLFVFFVFLLALRKYSFLKIMKSLLYIGISAMFIPMIWYVAAYRQGGGAFLDVAFAENFGRFFHSESNAINYDLGHKEGVWYNFVMLLAGFVPWTLLALFSLFGKRWQLPRKSFFKDACRWIMSLEKIKLFSLVAATCIIVFYTIPSSKRSVYLMPAYPFIAVLLAQYFIYITENRSKVTRVFATVLTTLSFILFMAGALMITKAVDFHALAASYTTSVSTLRTVESVTRIFTPTNIVGSVLIMLLFLSIVTVIYQMTKRVNIKILYATIFMVVCINLLIDGAIMKGVRNDSSARPFAEQIRRDYPSDDGIYVINNLRENYGNLYAINFYLGNTFRDFEKERPESGYFLTIEKDLPKVFARYETQYLFEQLAVSGRLGDIRSQAVLLRFKRR